MIDMQRIGLWRWEMLLILAIVTVAAGSYYLLYPWGRTLWVEQSKLRDKDFPQSRIDALPGAVAALEKRIVLYDSLMRVFEQRKSFNEAQVLQSVYACADSAGCSASRVEIGDPIAFDKGREIPIVFTGEGAYAAVGQFCAGIENLEYPTRLRQVTFKKTGEDLASVTIDFVIMDN
jgi:Tfp pilus assembly protein PilO